MKERGTLQLTCSTKVALQALFNPPEAERTHTHTHEGRIAGTAAIARILECNMKVTDF